MDRWMDGSGEYRARHTLWRFSLLITDLKGATLGKREVSSLPAEHLLRLHILFLASRTRCRAVTTVSGDFEGHD